MATMERPPDDSVQLITVFGFPEYNNLNEPKPFSNEPGTLIGFTTTFLVLSWIFVCLRLYVRFRVVKMLGWDDLFVSFYLLFTTVASIVFLCSIEYGAGQHFLLLTFGEVRKYLTLFYTLNVSLNFATAFIKLSLLFQFLRIFKKGTWSYRASVVGIVLVLIWGGTFTMLSIFPCEDVSSTWNILDRDTVCWAYGSQDPTEFTATLVAHNTLNTVFDIYITVLPMKLYFAPDATLKMRLGLLVLLLMGATVISISAWRVHETIYYKAGWYPTRDPTWYGPKSILLIVLEVNIASICASVPIFWPVIRQTLGAIFVTHEFSVKYEERNSVSSQARMGTSDSAEEHYKDPFVMDLVNPLHSRDGSTTVQSKSKSPVKNERSWLRL